MPAHIRSALTLTQLVVPVGRGGLLLGSWQAVYVLEHCTGRFARTVMLHLAGE